MHRRVFVIIGAVVAWSAGCGPPVDPKADAGVEICGNGVDDTGNGLTDCADPSCSEDAACLSADQCQAQTDCMGGATYRSFSAAPIPMCVAKQCVTPEAQIEMNFFVKNGWNGLQGNIRAVNTRFVKKLDVSGNPVTCETLSGIAPSHLEEDADQIERSKKFNLQAFDVTDLGSGYPGGTQIQVPLMNMSTGADFIIWTELWSNRVSTTTKMPTGRRIGWGCFQSGSEVAEIKVADAHPARSISVTMPNPQNP